MSVTGIEKLEFGVDDLTHCARFMRDFGLAGDASGQRFTTLSGARVELNPIHSPDLPPAFEAGNTLRRMTWGVADRAALDALRPKLSRQPAFREIDGALECQDPNGMTLRVQVTQQVAVTLNVEPINQWGDVRRIDTPSPVYDGAQPINVGHVVFFVEELAAVEAFYRDVLGFQVSDRYINRAVFLRCGVRGGHHNLFLLQLPNRKRGLNHVAFTVRDIHEVIGGGIAMNKNAWSTLYWPRPSPGLFRLFLVRQQPDRRRF